jgi:hypothetical protein
MIMINTPMMVPIIPRFIENLLSCHWRYPRADDVNNEGSFAAAAFRS